MNDDAILAKLAEEYLARLRAGEALSPEEFCREHEPYRAGLLEVLPMLSGLEELSKTGAPGPAAGSPPPFPGRLGEFVLRERLGAGGMGTVFRAFQISLNREVALKILSPAWSDSPELVRRFEAESRIIASLHHPHIVQVFGAGREGGRSFYVMELVAGRSLDIRTARPPREVARLAWQAAEALAYAHRNHVLHRDVKPANLLLDGDGDVHVGDFGLAVVLDADGTARTPSSREGTLRYMAPERLRDGADSCASDQYGLGATLYELLARGPIFPEADPAALARRIEANDIPPLAGVPRDLAAIVRKSLAFAPADRYPSMDAMAADLRRYLDGEPVAARRCGVLRRAALWARRRPAVAAWSGAAVLLALGLAAALVVGYCRTRAALAVADRTLSDIFSTYADQPGSRNTDLLVRLLPYYESIAARWTVYANEVVGAIALRSGRPEVAEWAFRNASDRYRLAESLAAQGKNAEAAALWRTLAAGDDVTAVRSLRALAGHLRAMPGQEAAATGDPALMGRAWALLEKLRAVRPGDPDLRFLAASILAENPRLGRGEDALAILKSLVAEYPERADARLLLVRLAGKINPRNPDFDARIRFALAQADELLARTPNEPGALSTVADVRLKYVGALSRAGKTDLAVRELERAIGLYSILARHPDAPRDAAASLKELEERLDELKKSSEKIRR